MEYLRVIYKTQFGLEIQVLVNHHSNSNSRLGKAGGVDYELII